MIIQCLSCGKSISSKSCDCPYCRSQITDITLEMNGIEAKNKVSEKVWDRVLQLVHR